MGRDKKVVKIGLVDKSSGRARITTHEVDAGPCNGRKLHRLLGVKSGELFVVDNLGHTLKEDGPLGDDEIVFMRDGREFEVIRGGAQGVK